ncbi:hypothetical protein VTO73DRAFT_5190 [Trametes versicolor]
MNVSFTSSGLTNSAVVDSATGKTLFEVSTPFSLHYNTTLRDAQNNVVGEFKQGMVHDEVTYQGRTMRVSEWLPKKSILSRSRTFVAPDGRSYRWDTGGMWKAGWRLFDCETGELVASVHSKKLFSKKKMNIDVIQEGLPILDAIVLSFLVCELLSRREQSVAEAAAVASG